MSAWPPLPYADWEPTKQTVHRYAQILGKVRMALVPPRNHWWHVTLVVGARGLTTGAMPAGPGRDAEIALDLVDHRTRVLTSDGGERVIDLGHRPVCADFYADLFTALADLGVDVEIRPEPFDLGDSPPLHEDRVNGTYDADAVARWWTVLRSTQRVLNRLQGGFVGKASPVHLFWHSFDLAHARFSGRPAPVPAEADRVTREAYSHEVVAFGFWPGDDRRTPFPAFYAYSAPEPDGLAERPLGAAAATWQDTGNGHLALLPYEDARAAADPDAEVLAFFRAAYEAGATLGGWDREALERRA
jgi:hypothetical protein